MKSSVTAMLRCLWGQIHVGVDVQHSFTQESGAQATPWLEEVLIDAMLLVNTAF